MTCTYYTIDLSKDTENVIHNGLWQLVRSGEKTHTLPQKFFKGPFPERNQLEVKLSTTYEYKKKIYSDKEFSDSFDILSKRRMKFTRRIEVVAQLKIYNWVKDSMLDSTSLRAVFYVDHSSVTEVIIGAKMYDWSNADSTIELEHPIDVPEDEMRIQAALIYSIAKELAQANQAEVDKIKGILAKVKI